MTFPSIPIHCQVHKAVGQYWAELARFFADAPQLPIDPQMFAQKMYKDYVPELGQAVRELSAKFPTEMEPAVRQMEFMRRQAQRFMQQARRFDIDASLAGPAWANRRLQKLDQCFTNPSMGLAQKEPEKR